MDVIIRYFNAPNLVNREAVHKDIKSFLLDSNALWLYPKYGYDWIRLDQIEAIRVI